MTIPKKPARATLAAQDAPPLELTPAEKSLLISFRLTDNEGREFVEKMALSQAQMWPRRTGPSLRLINGGMTA